jgi:hypothetical protein
MASWRRVNRVDMAYSAIEPRPTLQFVASWPVFQWLGVTGETHVDLVRRINPSQTLPGSVDYSQAIFGMMAIAGTGWSKIEGGSRSNSILRDGDLKRTVAQNSGMKR